MTKLDARERRLLDLAGSAHEPSHADRQRMRARLAARLGVGSGLMLTTSAVSAAVAGSALPTVKVLVTLLLSGLLGGAGFVAYRGVHAAGAPRASSLTSERGPSAARELRLASPKSAAVAPVEISGLEMPSAGGGALAHGSAAASVVAIAPTTRALGASERSVSASQQEELRALRSGALLAEGEGLSLEPRAVAEYPEVPAGVQPSSARFEALPSSTGLPVPRAASALDSETRLVRAGLAALHAGDPARALSLFDEHARTYPQGILADERAVERVVSLCELGRVPEARAAALLFLRDHGASPLSARVRASCGAASNP
jgi:RNA polymerase sigma-70 factor (ECF subfamily)